MIDRKYKILAINPCTKNIHTEEDSILFNAKDMCVPQMLRYYHDQCKMAGCDNTHLESIKLLLLRVVEFQKEEGSKLPDTNTPCEIDRCIKGEI